VLERPYWGVASRALGLTPPAAGRNCALSLAYQPIRNIAAAAAIAGPHRKASFVLLYDQRNPYFTGAGNWPGWARVLTLMARYSPVPVHAASWQDLLADDIDPAIRHWARDKHGLEANDER
jgi:hypothetical protein